MADRIIGKGGINLSDAVKAYLEEYQKWTSEEIRKIGDDVSKDAVNRLKSTSPKQKKGAKEKNSPHNAGAYARGWKVSVETTRLGTTYIINNAGEQSSLAWLLENGHALYRRDGSKYQSPQKPHIRSVETFVIDEYTRKVEEQVRNWKG